MTSTSILVKPQYTLKAKDEASQDDSTTQRTIEQKSRYITTKDRHILMYTAVSDEEELDRNLSIKIFFVSVGPKAFQPAPEAHSFVLQIPSSIVLVFVLRSLRHIANPIRRRPLRLCIKMTTDERFVKVPLCSDGED
jgi:hypothetical protein